MLLLKTMLEVISVSTDTNAGPNIACTDTNAGGFNCEKYYMSMQCKADVSSENLSPNKSAESVINTICLLCQLILKCKHALFFFSKPPQGCVISLV